MEYVEVKIAADLEHAAARGEFQRARERLEKAQKNLRRATDELMHHVVTAPQASEGE